MKKQLIIFGITALLFFISVSGCVEQTTSELKQPIVQFQKLSLTVKHINLTNYTGLGIDIPLYLENPNDKEIKLQILFIYVFDVYGNILLSFSLPDYSQLNCGDQCLTCNNITLGPHQNDISRRYSGGISKNMTTDGIWSKLISTNEPGMYISCLYKFNNQLQWSLSNIPYANKTIEYYSI